MIFRISTTLIDSFHKFLTEPCYSCRGTGIKGTEGQETLCPRCEGTGGQLEKDFIQQIVNPEFIKSKKMELGSAYHSCLEKPYDTYDAHTRFFQGKEGFMANGIAFPYESVRPAIDIINYLFPFEIKASKLYEVLGEQIYVIAQVDQLQGLWINEHKTTWSGFDYSKYENSVQGKYYMEIFNCHRVNYKVFDLYDGAHGIKLKDIHRFHFDWEERYRQVNKSLLADFMEFIKSRDLERYLINYKEIPESLE